MVLIIASLFQSPAAVCCRRVQYSYDERLLVHECCFGDDGAGGQRSSAETGGLVPFA